MEIKSQKQFTHLSPLWDLLCPVTLTPGRRDSDW